MSILNIDRFLGIIGTWLSVASLLARAPAREPVRLPGAAHARRACRRTGSARAHTPDYAHADPNSDTGPSPCAAHACPGSGPAHVDALAWPGFA